MHNIKKYSWTIPFIASYIIWAVFYRVCPLFYDMYVMKADYLVRGSNFIGVLKAVFFTGGCWKNARYLVNIINIYFVSYEWIFDFVVPFVFVLSVFFAQKVISEEKRWYTSSLGLGLFLCVSPGIVAQCYSYSYVLYLLPIAFICLFIYLIQRYMKDSELLSKWYEKALFLILIYCNACFNEHISCAFSVIMLWYLGKSIFELNRKDKLLIAGTVISLLQTIYMNMYLIVMKTRPLAEGGSDLMATIRDNFRILIIETWLSNPLIIAIFLIMLIVTVRSNKVWMIIDSLIGSAYIIWQGLIYYFGSFDKTVRSITSDSIVPFASGKLWWLWAILYVGINLFILYQLYMISESIATVFFAGGCSTVPVLVTPNTGWRISAFYVFMIIISTVMLSQVNKGNKMRAFLGIALGVIACAWGLYSFIPRIVRIDANTTSVQMVAEETRTLQENGEWDMDKDIMFIPEYDSRDVIDSGRFDDNTYYMWNFCYVNGLDKETLVEDANN